MDFFKIRVKEPRGKKDVAHEVYADFIVGRSKDLMVKGGHFHAVWDEERGLWCSSNYEVIGLVDREVQKYADKLRAEGTVCEVKTLSSYDTGRWDKFLKFLRSLSDNYHDLDARLIFANTPLKKTDYATRRLSYPLARGPHPAYDELVGTLYNEEERRKFEWAIGAIMCGDSRSIQKFLVFHGDPGTGKSTVMNIIEALCDGYTVSFDASALVSHGSTFGLEAFKDNPLVAIQQDGDLSRIEDNSRLNALVSGEKMRVNEKFKPTYDSVITSFLFMGTNKAVRITDAKSGLIRRLIDVYPTGNTIEVNRYTELVSQIPFELGAIAHHCLDVYKTLGKHHYKTYEPTAMLMKTNVIANFVDAYYDIFKEQDGATLKQAYSLYKEYCSEANIEFKAPLHKFREELKTYFEEFIDRAVLNGVHVRSYFRGLKAEPFKKPIEGDVTKFELVLEETKSLLDTMFADNIAQYAKADGTPQKYWDDSDRIIKGVLQRPDPKAVVDTVLSDLDTSKLHYVKVPQNHIVIDFDLTDDEGNKSLEKNKVAASIFPSTYAEISQGGQGIHLHYIWEGDVSELAPKFDDGIEIKVYRDNSGLRRKLTKCNNVAVATINSGLPLKEKKMLSPSQVQSEKGLRDLIARNLHKDIHPSTKSSIDFINHILEDAHKSGLEYDVSDLQPRIMAFAQKSTNKAVECLRIVKQMKFVSEGAEKPVLKAPVIEAKDERLVFFDVEVYPNLLVICWKYEGSPDVVRMINPTSAEVQSLFQYKLVGFYNRKYDNHILMARFLGYPIEKIYELSQNLINDKGNTYTFGQAFALSYTDVYEFSSKKQSLKVFMIELGLDHIEMGIPWDQPVPPELIDTVVEYCVNDVIGTEAVFNARKQDFVARQILAELSGLTVNDTTQKHAAKIIFGNKKDPQEDFVYTQLEEQFPGYHFDPYSKDAKSTYRGEVVGEGGYVYAEPGLYHDVALLDIASMHPTSIYELNAFGVHTGKFWEMVQARLAIKSASYELKEGRPAKAEAHLDVARHNLLGGKLAPYLEDVNNTQALSDALKIVINIVYGLTSAVFLNPFKDPRNIDNIVAKRGALFMIDLKHAVQEQGFTVAHIKTDSIKIPDATQDIIDFVMKFGEKYGYTFEEEAKFSKFCLVNDAVYIAKKGDKWDATGAEFKEPYVFKTMFSNEPIKFDDLCQTKSVVKGAIYLVPEEVLEERDNTIAYEKSIAKLRAKTEGIDVPKVESNPVLTKEQLDKMQFVGKHGRFTPVTKETGGRVLVRVQDGKMYAVTGTKGHYWAESVVVQKKNEIDMAFFDVAPAHKPGAFAIDMTYFEKLAKNARATLDEFGGGYAELIS
jgi:hypothetical protein